MLKILLILSALIGPFLSAHQTELAPERRLVYRARPGQTREYKLFIQARGKQLSLGEQQTVKWDAEVEIVERVTEVEENGNFWLQITSRILKIEDPTGLSAQPHASGWPAMNVHMTPRGELLGSSPITESTRMTMRERTLAELIKSCTGTVIMPENLLSLNSSEGWEWAQGASRQENRLVAISRTDASIASFESHAHAPLDLSERSEELALTTYLHGEMEQDSRMDLWLEEGLVARHKGTTRLRSKGEITLELSDGVRRFPVQQDITLEFDLRLIRVDGLTRPQAPIPNP